MLSDNAPSVVVARFLKAHHYNQTKTLEAFLEEAGLPEDAAATKPGDWTIEQIVQEKTQFDASLSFERRQDNADKGWTEPAPSIPNEPTAGVSSNILCVAGNPSLNVISVATADRICKSIAASTPYGLVDGSEFSSDSPVLSICFPRPGFSLTTSMSGKLMLHDVRDQLLLDACCHHAKYAVQVVSTIDSGLWLVATAAWDRKINFYTPDLRRLEEPNHYSQTLDPGAPAAPGILGHPIHTQTLLSNPESIAFVRNPDTSDVYLVASRRDSTFLYYFRVLKATGLDGMSSVTIKEAGRQNLAPHSNAWVAFTPCSLALCPTDPSLLAVATSHMPHLKLILVRLLFPEASSMAQIPQTSAALARADLAKQDKEDAAISLQVTTMAPQTPYSTPQVVWRPDGSGVWVNGDDGVIRGIEAKTGKIICVLKAHEAGSKVRTLWAGELGSINDQKSEVVVSGGFDKRVFVWTVQEGSDS